LGKKANAIPGTAVKELFHPSRAAMDAPLREAKDPDDLFNGRRAAGTDATSLVQAARCPSTASGIFRHVFSHPQGLSAIYNP